MENESEPKYKKFLVAAGQILALLVFFIAVFSLIKWIIGKIPAQYVNPPEAPAASAPSSFLKATFTELFSGVGWKNEEKSNVYQDLKTTVISFPPAYGWEDSSAPGSALKGETVIAVKGNGKEIAMVTQSGKIFDFNTNTDSFDKIGQITPTTTTVKGAALDYDSSAGTWFVAASSDSSAFAGPANRVVPVKISGTVSGLACGGGECLVLAGSSISRFPENNPAALGKVYFPQGNALEKLSLGKAKNIIFAGGTQKSGGDYTGMIFKYSAGSQFLPAADKSFSSKYPGTIRFGYDSENNKILAVYAAYIGQAYLFEVSEAGMKFEKDYSKFFPQRLMEGQAAGEVKFEPDLFYKSGAWWAGSLPESPVQKAVRIERGVAADLNDEISSSLGSSGVRSASFIFLAPGSGDRQIYVIASGKNSTNIFRLTDLGFNEQGKIIWESKNLNQWDKEVVSGAVFRAEADENGGKINYFISGNGGQNWAPAAVGQTIEFGKGIFGGKPGNDFRYRIEISPAGDSFQTPWVDTIGVEYTVPVNQ